MFMYCYVCVLGCLESYVIVLICMNVSGLDGVCIYVYVCVWVCMNGVWVCVGVYGVSCISSAAY